MYQSIETEYNGTRYRSRTEARHAMMMDRAGISFQYEPDGYAFEDNGRRYVPDFWVHDWDSFLEVKPDGFAMIHGEWPEERCKCEVLNEATGKDVLMACGSPDLTMRLNLFQANKVSWRHVYLANYAPAHAILTAKKHRFDWNDERSTARRRFSGEGSIGLLATNIMKGIRKGGELK